MRDSFDSSPHDIMQGWSEPINRNWHSEIFAKISFYQSLNNFASGGLVVLMCALVIAGVFPQITFLFVPVLIFGLNQLVYWLVNEHSIYLHHQLYQLPDPSHRQGLNQYVRLYEHEFDDRNVSKKPIEQVTVTIDTNGAMDPLGSVVFGVTRDSVGEIDKRVLVLNPGVNVGGPEPSAPGVGNVNSMV